MRLGKLRRCWPTWSAASMGVWAVVAMGAVAGTAAVAHRMALAQAAVSPAAVSPAAGADNATAKAGAGVVVVTVNGKPIYQGDVDRNVAAFLKGRKVEPADMPKVQAAALKQMIDSMLLHGYLLSQKDLVSRSDINAAVNELKANLRSQNITFEAFLAGRNTTEQAFMSELAMQAMLQKYATTHATEEGLKEFFEEHKAAFDGTIRRISHILFRPDGAADEAEFNRLTEQAKSIREQLQSGQLKFDEAATKYSAGPSRQRGGDLGYVAPGVMDPKFTATAYELKLDEVSEPVRTPFGIHLIKVTEIKAGTKKLDEVKSAVQNAYLQSVVAKMMEDQLKTAKIEFAGNYPYFKPGTEELVLPGSAGGGNAPGTAPPSGTP